MLTSSVIGIVALALASISAVQGNGVITQAVIGSTSNGNTIDLCVKSGGEYYTIEQFANQFSCYLGEIEEFDAVPVHLQVIPVICSSAANQGRTNDNLAKNGYDCQQYSVNS